MAIFNRDADPNTAVTAFLAQFSVSSTGDIRHSAGTDTFHIWWMHRSLQKLAWDFTVSGDDDINLTNPNPSNSEALGAIITLLDHTTNFSINYNVDDTAIEFMFGGSVEQNIGNDRYGGLKIIGAVNSPTQLQIIQDDGLLTSHWGTGKNQTDADVLLRVMIKVRSGGVDIDGERLIIKANEWGDTYAIARTTLGLGEGVTSINTFSDPQNNTDLAVVQAYTGIVNTEGYQLIDIGDGSGDKPYYSKWNYGGNNAKAEYEWVKSLLVRGTSAILYGLDGDLFTALTGTFSYDGLIGVFSTVEQITWSTGSGQLMAKNGTDIWFQILTGINPIDNQTITGVSSSATATVNGTTINISSSPQFLGVYTGSSWIGAFGIGFEPTQLVAADSVTPLDTGVPINPPNNVPISVSVEGALDPHVMLARNNGSGGILYTEYTAASGNNSGDATFVINEAIKSDTSQTGEVMVKQGTSFEPIEYDSWSGSTFNLVGTLGQNYTAGKDVFIPFLYKAAIGASDPRVASTSVIYSADVVVLGWVRHGEPSSPDKPVNISGTITTAGLALTVKLDDES